jgi:hypothetical protein
MPAIGHLVKFPDSPDDDPPRGSHVAWGCCRIEDEGTRSGDALGFKLTRVDQHPPRYEEHDGFLYVSKDHVASKIIGSSSESSQPGMIHLSKHTLVE